MTALLVAARDGHFEAARALIAGGAEVNQVSGSEKTSPLVIAICNGHYDVAKLLLDRGADPNLATIDGLAALYATEDTEWAQVGWAPNPITFQEKVTYLDLMKGPVGARRRSERPALQDTVVPAHLAQPGVGR